MKNKLGFYNSIALPLCFWFLLAYLLPLDSCENFVLFLFMALSFYLNFYCARRFFSKEITQLEAFKATLKDEKEIAKIDEVIAMLKEKEAEGKDACETLVTTGQVVIAGEVKTHRRR